MSEGWPDLAAAGSREWAAYVRASLRRGRVWDLITPVARVRRVRADRRLRPDGVPVSPVWRPGSDAGRVVIPAHTTAPQPFVSVRLATREWAVADGVPWRGDLRDPEDVFAAHRFSWMPVALAQHGEPAARVAATWLHAWLADHGGEEGPGWDAYSISERLVALTHLAASAPPDPAWSPAIESHQRVLIDRLEFRGTATNNHLLNNARALYLAAVVHGTAETQAYARTLVRFGLSRFFIDGFLREGTSHYQALLCRTLAELRWAAGLAGDRPFVDELDAALTLALRRLAWFETETTMALLGDTSPDLTPADTTIALGYLTERVHPEREDAPALCAPDAGFARIRHSGWTVWTHAHQDAAIPGWSHAHADTGGVVAEFKGDPVIVDGGRSTYAATPLGRYGRSIRSHSAIEVDGAEPCVIQGLNGYPELLSEAYLGHRPELDARADASAAYMTIINHGYARLGDGLLTRREVVAAAHGLQISDYVEGRGRHRVTSRIHLHPSVRVTREGEVWRLVLRSGRTMCLEGAGDAVVMRGVEGPDPMGWYSDVYGRSEACTTLVADATHKLPVKRQVRVVCVE